jgi:hypothetical protein
VGGGLRPARRRHQGGDEARCLSLMRHACLQGVLCLRDRCVVV